MDNLIRIYGNAMSNEKCQYFIDKFEAHSEMHETQVTRNNEVGMTALTRLNILKQVDTSFKEDSKFLDNLFRENVERYKSDCQIKSFQFPNKFGFESFVIKRYLPDTTDEFPAHVDVGGIESTKRFLVMSIYLTDNEAGQTELEVLAHDNHGFEFGSSPCQRGNILMFPPYWPWVHAGKVPTKKPKYILGTYCQYNSDVKFPVVQEDCSNEELQKRLAQVCREIGKESTTNVKGSMTDWNMHKEDPDFMEVCRMAIALAHENAPDDPVAKSVELMPWDCWGARYSKGDYAKIHNHWPMLWSWVYNVECCKYCSPLIFNDSFGVHSIQPKSGNMILFPSGLQHYVPKQQCDHDRIIISGNITMNAGAYPHKIISN